LAELPISSWATARTRRGSHSAIAVPDAGPDYPHDPEVRDGGRPAAVWFSIVFAMVDMVPRHSCIGQWFYGFVCCGEPIGRLPLSDSRPPATRTSVWCGVATSRRARCSTRVFLARAGLNLRQYHHRVAACGIAHKVHPPNARRTVNEPSPCSSRSHFSTSTPNRSTREMTTDHASYNSTASPLLGRFAAVRLVYLIDARPSMPWECVQRGWRHQDQGTQVLAAVATTSFVACSLEFDASLEIRWNQ